MPSACARRARFRVEARVGVNTGEVVVRTIETGGHTEYTPVGHATNLAARMQTAAPAGSIAVSEETRRLFEGYFEFRGAGTDGGQRAQRADRGLRGDARRAAADAFRARGAARADQVRRARARAAADAARARTGAGRDTGRSSRWWRRRAPASRGCSTSSRRRCRTDAKCSKPTRCRTARRRRGCRCSNCCAAISAFRTPTMRPRDARKSVPRLPRSTRHSVKRCRICSDCSAYRKAPIRLPQMDPQIKRQRTLDAIKRIILRESLKHPLVVIFEDLHWIDAQTQALLDLLADSVANARVLLLVNYRPEYRHEWSEQEPLPAAQARPAGRRKRRGNAGGAARRRRGTRSRSSG